MNTYVSHATSFDFRSELYTVLKYSKLAKDHNFIFPHEDSNEQYETRVLFEKKGLDVVLAEVSYPSTGQGIELGWANMQGVRIICVSKKGAKVSGALQVVAKDFIEYESGDDMIEKVEGTL